MEEKFTRADRDLLIKVDTKLNIVCDSLNELKNNYAERLMRLESNKANENEVQAIYNTRTPQWDNFNARIVNLEKWRAGIIATFGLVGIVISLVIYIYYSEEKFVKESLQELKVDIKTHAIQDK